MDRAITITFVLSVFVVVACGVLGASTKFAPLVLIPMVGLVIYDIIRNN
jgi:hypothetical protein